MRKIIFTLLLLMMACNIYAQTAKVDTTLYKKWTGTVWQNDSRTINHYDGDCRLITVLSQNWDTQSSLWKNFQLATYTYVSGEHISFILIQYWDSFTNSWNDINRQIYTYDGSFKPLTIVTQTYFFGQWSDFISTSSKYDKNGYLDSTLVQMAFGGPLENTSLEININNNDGTPQQSIDQNWNTTTSSWDNRSKYSFTYNGNKNITFATIEFWDKNASSWQIGQQKTYTYSGTGKLLSYLTQGWQSNQWVNQSLDSKKYDNNDFLINYLTQTWNGSSWDNYVQTNYVNNGDGNEHQESLQTWDEVSSSWLNNIQRTFSYSSSCLLPLKLMEFSAVKKNNTVDLKWQTSQEINTSYFTVQRSVDGTSFMTVGKNVTANAGGTINNYNYADNVENVAADRIYYRLKIFDKDGSYSVSKIITISLAGYAGQLRVYPNPAKDQLFASFNLRNSSKAELRITDITGKNVYSQTLSKTPYNNITSINISSLGKGVYYVLLITDTGTQKTQFLKQ